MSSCPSSPPVQFPSPPKEEFTIRVSDAKLHASEIWAPTLSATYDPLDVQYNYKGQRSQDLLERMQLDGLTKVLCTRWFRWHSYEDRSDGWLEEVQKLDPTGDLGHDDPTKTWKVVISKDCLALCLRPILLTGTLGVGVPSGWTHHYTRD